MKLTDGARITGELAAVVFVAVLALGLIYGWYIHSRGDVIVLTAAEYEHLRLTMENAQRALTRSCGGR